MKRYVYLLSFCVLLPFCELIAQNFSKYPFLVKPLDKNVNAEANDYAPFLTGDGGMLYFTSYREVGSKGEADVFVSRKTGEAWSQAENAGASFNTEENDGAISIAGDGRTIVFAADDRPDGFGDTDLYIGRLEGGTVTEVRNLGINVNSKYWDSQPCVSSDGMKIYFASNRPDGYGGTDIWMTQNDGWGRWSVAVPLGSMINSKKDERSPYCTKDGGTLYFASNGIAGYGGYDIWMSVIENGEWGQPVNLGPVVNSDMDELFLFAPVKDERFYLASSRLGGYGGLDIYVGTPNIFGSGMFRLTVSVLDSISSRPLPSIVNIFDEADNTPLLSFVTNTQVNEYSNLLPAGRAYRVEARIRDYPTREADIDVTPPNSEEKVLLLFGPITVAEFDLGRYNIPFFVTGYYRPNTSKELAQIFSLLEGPLHDANYIERFKKGSRRHQQYQTYSETVDAIFQTVFTAAIEEIFPRFKSQGLPNEYLEIKVVGYADPQPIIGKYLDDETISFEDTDGRTHAVRTGDIMDNLKLSGLRAYHSGEYLNELFTDAAIKGFTDYNELKRKGKIKYVYIGGGVSDDNSDYAVQRRIRIIISRTSEDVSARGAGDVFDLNEQMKKK